jgi:hypothetical protein
MIKTAAQCRASHPAHGHSSLSVVACHVRPARRLAGPRTDGPVQRRSGPRRENGARDGAVAHSPAAWWWLAGGKVQPMSS